MSAGAVSEQRVEQARAAPRPTMSYEVVLDDDGSYTLLRHVTASEQVGRYATAAAALEAIPQKMRGVTVHDVVGGSVIALDWARAFMRRLSP